MNREIQTNTMEEQVYRILLNDIRTLKLPPGSRVNENKIAEDLQISRSPVRDAIKRLKGDRVIVTIPNKGAFVRRLTSTEMDEMFDARLMMELYGLDNMSAPLGESEREVFTSILERSEAVCATRNMDEFMQLDFKLHRGIVALHRNDYIIGMYENLNWQLYTIYLESEWDRQEFKRVRNDHTVLINGLLNGDIEVARQHLMRHITLARKIIVARSGEESNHL
jgi:DNA-binding GntR family transcriptional regulator